MVEAFSLRREFLWYDLWLWPGSLWFDGFRLFLPILDGGDGSDSSWIVHVT